MKQSDFNLPPEYQEKPEFFDIHNISKETDTKNQVIESLLRMYNANNILDLTCGTGSQVFFLHAKGYNVLGSDFSPDLIKIAKKKAEEKNLTIDFRDGDMRNIKLGQFDAVITMFNAIGHLTKDNFSVALENIHHNLTQGGIYIFDIFNLEAMSDQEVKNLSMLTESEHLESNIHLSQFSCLDRKSGLLTSYNNYSIQTNLAKPENFQSHFTLQIYKSSELKYMLNKNGFEVTNFYDLYGNEFKKDKSLNILCVARKI